MLGLLAHRWWVFLLRGILAVLFGIAALLWPALTLATLVLVFGAYVLADGLFAVVGGIASIGANQRWWALLLEGIVGILAGLAALFYPRLTELTLLYVIAAWAVVTGVMEIVSAIRLRKEIDNEGMMALSGVLSIALGVVLFLFPGAGALGATLTIGVYALISGIAYIVLSFRLRKLKSL